MVLWVDKHRPKALEELKLHTKITNRLQSLVNSDDFPHLLLYGPSGAGKKTRVMAILNELYGPGALKVRVEHKTYKIQNKNVEIVTIGSNYHIEVNPSDVGIRDRLVVQEVIREIAETETLDPTHKKAFKVVILSEVDRLSIDAQQALRRTMEKYVKSCRLILLCESACRVMEPLRSRCLCIRIPSPSNLEIVAILQTIASKEKKNLPDDLAIRIADASSRNTRRAILMLEACKVEDNNLHADQKVRIADWERFIVDLGKKIIEDQSPQCVMLSRNKIYELLVNCIPPEMIIKTLAKVLLARVDDQIKHEIIQAAAYYEHRVKIGSKAIFHIEAFIVKFMQLYKKWLANFGF